MRKYLLAAFPLIAWTATVLALPAAQPVGVTGGMVSGAPGREPSVTVFKGIPFAAPPIGDARWRPPAPVVPWQGVRAATTFGPSCIQTIVQERKPWTFEFMAHNEISEDCLHLNVWTAAKSTKERRPVFVYVYGGAFTEGSTAVPVYDGEGLARKGLVVVTANYRVGVLGFLAHPELSKESANHAAGNYGLLDQIAALRWIHDNIAAFGGDPTRVTIAGQSAGLFHRAIVQSGGSSVGAGGIALRSRSLADAEADGLKLAEAKGAASLAALRAMSWKTLMEPLPAPAPGAGPALRFSPIVDGYVLPASVREAVSAGKHNDVPILTGANLGELGGLSTPEAPVTVASFTERARRQYGPLADEFLRLFPAPSDEQAAQAQAESSREQALVSMYLWAMERARTSRTPAFLYLWDHTLPGPDAERYRAFHSSEVPYVLNTLAMSDRPFTERDRAIADMMSSYWANFATAGDPNGSGLPRWAAAGGEQSVMEVGDNTKSLPLTRDAARFAFFERFLTQAPSR